METCAPSVGLFKYGLLLFRGRGDRDEDRDRKRGSRGGGGGTSERGSSREDGAGGSKGSREGGKAKENEEEEDPSKPGGVDLNADMTPEEIQMMQLMGIPFSFDTTQGKMVRDRETLAECLAREMDNVWIMEGFSLVYAAQV